uniref:histidine kinase n=1 Tax=Nitratidesulfovibrio vulgaris (strain DSM 19637 / Miyazaki F) TaxID=883 RepID=B8DQZ8_NITV9
MSRQDHEARQSGQAEQAGQAGQAPSPDAASASGPNHPANPERLPPDRQGDPIPLFEHSVAPMLLVDPENGTIVDANPAACRFYGHPRERMAGMPIAAINTLDEDQLAAHLDEAFHRERTAFRFRHRAASGLVREVEVHSGPVWLNGRVLLHSVVHDVSFLHDSAQRVERVQRLNDLRAALIHSGAPEEKLRLLAREILAIFGAGTCRIWLARQGDRCAQCPHAGAPCPTAPRTPPVCLHMVVEEPASPSCQSAAAEQARPDPRIIRIPFRHGPVGRAASASTRRPVLHATPEADAPLSCDCGMFTAYAIRIGQGISGGVLGVHLPALDPITDMQLEGLAHTTAHLLQAARTAEATRRALRGLDNRIRKRTAQLRRANQLLRHEVAERRRAELALRRSRDLLEHGERVGQLGSYWRDLETGRGQWSDNLFHMFGFPVATEAPSFAGVFECIHPDDRVRIAEQLHHVMAHRTSALIEYRYRGAAGQYRHARQQMTFDTSARTGHREPVVMLGMVQDITEQRQRDELLRLQRDLLLALGITTTVEDCLGLCLRTALRAESVDAGAAWLRVDLPDLPDRTDLPDRPEDPAGHGARGGHARHEWRLVAAQGFNPAVLDRVRCLPSGTPATRLMEAGRPVPETHPEQESCCMLTGDVELDALATASSVCCSHLLPILHDGRAVACLLTGTRGPGPMRKAARHHVEAVAAQGGSAFARIMQQQSLRESEANLRALLNAPRLSAFLLDPAGRVLACNATGAGRLGTTPDAMLGRALGNYVPHDLRDRRTNVLSSVVATATPATFRDARSIHIFEHTLYPITDETGRVHRVAWLAEDVAHEVALERQLRQAQKMEAVGTLAGGIAHDFNNILGVIMSNIEMLRDTGLTGRAATRADRILRAALRARDVVRQLLAFGRPADEPYATLDLCRTVADALHMVKPSIPASVTLRTLLPVAPLPVHGDITQIHQVLLNLCTNAVHAMPDGGVLDVSLAALVLGGDEVLRGYPELSPGRYACLSVADSGQGMTAAQLERVFEPFFTTKPQGMGSGLGLSMVHGIVRQHGGTVRAHSQPEQGACFDVLLPLADMLAAAEAGAAPAATAPEYVPDTPQERPLHVLVVDDEHDFRQSVAEMLHALGHRSTGTSDASDALQLLAAGRYDVALLDLRMPGGSGTELARAIRARGFALPLVLCTGNECDIPPEELAETGLTLIGKPFTGEELSKHLHVSLKKA